MVTKELAIQRLGGKFWSSRFLGVTKGELVVEEEEGRLN